MNDYIVIRKKLFKKTLGSSPIIGKKSLEPFKSFAKINDLPINIVSDVKVRNKAELHKNFIDLIICLNGNVNFICGGKLVNPKYKIMKNGSLNKNEITADKIIGGKNIQLKQGDWLWIPANTPHQHGCNKVAHMIFIKIKV